MTRANHKVICISIYLEDLDRLDGMVHVLKSRSNPKMNRSGLIRLALSRLKVEGVSDFEVDEHLTPPELRPKK